MENSVTHFDTIGSEVPNSGYPRPISESGDIFAGQPERKRYFRRLKHILKLGFLIAYLVPITILTFYFDSKLDYTIRESASLHLAALAESQRNTIDLFMQKRIVNIFNLFHSKEFSLSPGQEEMDVYLANLTKANDAFVDIGFFNPQGIQIGYSGPYPHLLNRDYRGEEWYRELTTTPQSYIVTDLYLGLRHKPHFTIGIKQLIDGQYYVIRTSLEPHKLYPFLKPAGHGGNVDGFLINREGVYQAVDSAFGNLLEPAVFIPPAAKSADVAEMNFNGKQMLLAYIRLKEVPWCLVMWQPLEATHQRMSGIRGIMIIGTAALVLALMGITWFIVERMIKWAESVEHDRAELKTQLFHTQKLVSVGELAGGVAHEINNPLAIIAGETGVVRDMLDPKMGLECRPEDIIRELDVIDKAVYRAKSITQKILSFVRRTEPKLVPCDVRQLLEDVVSGLKEQEFIVSNIDIVRDYDPDVPLLMLDPGLMRQVFLNLINNASDAVGDTSTITLSARLENDRVKVTIADSGIGMHAEQVEKIFMPFYTTKEVGQGTGLGLPISLNIVEGFGGHIEVESTPGLGSAFTVVLPISGESHREKEKSTFDERAGEISNE